VSNIVTIKIPQYSDYSS